MTDDNDRLVLRAGTGRDVVRVTPESAGWGYSGLHVVVLAPGESQTWTLEHDEALAVPLRGGVELTVSHPDLPDLPDLPDGVAHVALSGRPDVFSGPTDVAYLPLGSTVTAAARDDAPGGARLALATARATRVLPLRHVAAAEARIDLRGAGPCSRRVTNYTLGTDVAIDHLLVCEVLTPGGNWSSYPPHKHDVHSDEPGHEERELEEIYYFEVAEGGAVGPDGVARPGVGYHRTYGSPGHPVEVLTPVATGDTALVPHGYHGPCSAAPGYDLYYLNVMAGPATDGRWLSTDDPDLAWIRDTWSDQQVDPRLAPTGPLAPENSAPPKEQS